MGSRLVSPRTISADAIALIGALAAITLTVLAIVGIAPRTLTAIAAICTGAAVLGHGALITRRIFALRSPVGATFEQAKLGETASDEVLGGACAIALGVLALIGIEPTLLLGIAAIAIGGALVMSGPTREKLPHLSAVQEKYATLRPTRTGQKHRARRRTSKRRGSSGGRAKKRVVSRMRLRKDKAKDKVSAPMVARRDRKKSSRRSTTAAASAAGPKSLTELIAELPPPPSQAAAPPPDELAVTDSAVTTNEDIDSAVTTNEDVDSAVTTNEDIGPLFEPELLAAAHANPDLIDTTVIGRAAAESNEVVAPPANEDDIAPPANRDDIVKTAVAAQSEPPEVIADDITRDVAGVEPVIDGRSEPDIARRSEPDIARRSEPDIEPVSAAPELATAHDAEAEASKVVTEASRAPAEAPVTPTLQDREHRGSRRGGLRSALRMAASAFGKAKELKHKIDGALEAHPIEHRAPVDERATDKTDRKANEADHALVPYNELAHGSNALEVIDHEQALAPPQHVDTHVNGHVATRVSEHVDTHAGELPHDLEVDTHVEANERAIARDLELRASAPPLEHIDDAIPSIDKPSGLVTDEAAQEHHVLMADGSQYKPEPHTDVAVAKGLEHEREALANAQHIVEMIAGEPEPAADMEPAANKKLEAEKAREGDPTIDRRAGAAALDVAYQSEVVAKALELEHQLDHHLESEALHEQERKEQPKLGDEAPRENKRDTIAEVEPVPTTSAEIHRERALFAGGAAWVVGGLAAVVLGVLALAGVARPFVLIEIAFLVAAASILVSALMNGARLAASHPVHEHDHDDDDVDDAIDQPPALHARARERRVELHR